MNIAHEETKYDGTPYALTIKIAYDDAGDTESPLENDDAIIFASYSRRDGATVYGSADGYDFSDMAEMQRFTADHIDGKIYKVFALWAYIHSGTCYRAAEFG